MTPQEKYKTPPYYNIGPNAMKKFFEKLVQEAQKIDYIMSADVAMLRLAVVDRGRTNRTRNCHELQNV